MTPLASSSPPRALPATTTPRDRRHITSTTPPEPIRPSTLLSIGTSTFRASIGSTTLAVGSVPLLVGGVATAGESVPISYLQITNVGTSSARLTGFWVIQNGTAPTASIVGLSTVDDSGGSRGYAASTAASSLFINGSAFVPTDAYIEPGQLRLFTIKAMLAPEVSASLGTTLMIDVTGVETTAALHASFPIRGTTWTISN
jgi:hypothetical protein